MDLIALDRQAERNVRGTIEWPGTIPEELPEGSSPVDRADLQSAAPDAVAGLAPPQASLVLL